MLAWRSLLETDKQQPQTVSAGRHSFIHSFAPPQTAAVFFPRVLSVDPHFPPLSLFEEEESLKQTNTEATFQIWLVQPKRRVPC